MKKGKKTKVESRGAGVTALVISTNRRMHCYYCGKETIFRVENILGGKERFTCTGCNDYIDYTVE